MPGEALRFRKDYSLIARSIESFQVAVRLCEHWGERVMGSSGSGSFSDYSGSKKPDGTGGSSGKDLCRTAFTAKLEELEQCDFFVSNNTVPAVDTVLSILLDGRIFAVTENGTKVGALPTRLNYLAGCLKEGITYVGIVTVSGLQPFPFVSVDFTPQ
jgi:hypothetical protein